MELDWKEIHARLETLARTQAEHDYEIGRWLLAALRARVDEMLGMASITEYGERLFGYVPRMVGERLRVARDLEPLPQTTEGLRSGNLCWSAVREITRVATPETEHAWVEKSLEKSWNNDFIASRIPTGPGR